MSRAHVRSFVIVAVNQVLESYEIEDLNYFEILGAAKRKYSANWKLYRQSKNMWTEQDEQRSKRYPVPSEAAQKIFDTDEEVQRLLASRDSRLPMFRDKLEEIMKQLSSMTPSEDDIITAFISFARSTRKYDPYPHSVAINERIYVFPGKDIYALWICLKNMCCFL